MLFRDQNLERRARHLNLGRIVPQIVATNLVYLDGQSLLLELQAQIACPRRSKLWGLRAVLRTRCCQEQIDCYSACDDAGDGRPIAHRVAAWL